MVFVKKRFFLECIECSICSNWIHRRCAGLTKKQFIHIGATDNYWYCTKCIENFPFHNITDEEICFLNTDLYSSSASLCTIYEKCTKLNVEKFKYQSSFNENHHEFDRDINPDVNLEVKDKDNCKYYTTDQFNKHKFSNKDFSIINYNARSLKSNSNKIKDPLSELNLDFDIITIVETWFDDKDDISEFVLDGYNCYNINRSNKKGGGVVIYIKSDLKIKILQECTKTVNNNFECRTLF